MKKNSRIFTKAFSLILAAVLMTMCFSVSASAAAARRKQLSTMKEYGDDGRLRFTTTCKYNKNGYLTSFKIMDSVWSWPWQDASFKWTFKKGVPTRIYFTSNQYDELTGTYSNGKIKKAEFGINNDGDKAFWSASWSYDKKGRLKKLSYSCGRNLGIYNEKVTETYNSKGYALTRTVREDKKTVKYKIKNTVKNGVLRKMTAKGNDGSSETTTYDSHGNITKKVTRTSSGKKTTWTYKNKYKGSYLVQMKKYYNGKYEGKMVYTYTSAKYPLKNISRSDFIFNSLTTTYGRPYISYPAA